MNLYQKDGLLLVLIYILMDNEENLGIYQSFYDRLYG